MDPDFFEIDDFVKRIQEIQFKEWGDYKNIQLPKGRSVPWREEPHDYGLIIYKFLASDFDYDFVEFVARVTLYTTPPHFYNQFIRYGPEGHKLIYNNMDFKREICGYFDDNYKKLLPKDTPVKFGYWYGDANGWTMLIHVGKYYMVYDGFGS